MMDNARAEAMNDLNNFFSNISTDRKEPIMLKRTEVGHVKMFMASLKEYKDHGGKKCPLQFIESSVLETIRDYKLGNADTTAADILDYLNDKIKPKSWEDICDILESNVKIDASASDAEDQIQGLFISLKETMKQTGIKPDGTCEMESFLWNFAEQKVFYWKSCPMDSEIFTTRE